jgi:hypothetical protein
MAREQASATTSATGVATTTLKLNQKNGSHNLTATYLGDPTKHLGSSSSNTFKLQVKSSNLTP